MLIPFATSEPFLIAESVGIVILVFLLFGKTKANQRLKRADKSS